MWQVLHSEMNLYNPKHMSEGIHPHFEIQERRQHKSLNRALMTPQRGLISSKSFVNTVFAKSQRNKKILKQQIWGIANTSFKKESCKFWQYLT